MASKDFGDNGKGKPAGKRGEVVKAGDAAFRGYINLTLTAAEKEAYRAWAIPETVFAFFSAQVEDGVNVSIKRDPKQAGFLASATQRDASSPNAGLCVTARAGDAVTAFGRLMYVLALLSRSPSWEDTAPVADPDRW